MEFFHSMIFKFLLIWGPPCTYTHAYVHANAWAYDIIGIPLWRQPFGIRIIMFNMYTCMCATPPHPHLPTPRGDPQISKNSISLELI